MKIYDNCQIRHCNLLQIIQRTSSQQATGGGGGVAPGFGEGKARLPDRGAIEQNISFIAIENNITFKIPRQAYAFPRREQILLDGKAVTLSARSRCVAEARCCCFVLEAWT